MDLRRALLERKQLLRTERFVVDLRGGFDEVLEVGAGKEVAEVDEFAVAFVFDIDGAPAILAAADGLAVDRDILLGADDGEGDDGLFHRRLVRSQRKGCFKLTLIWLFMADSSLSYSSLS